MSNTDTATADEPFDIQTGEILEALPVEVSPVIAAEINQQVATAHRYPRRRDREISDEIMSRATLNTEIAAECMYNLNRDGKDITGASVRFAEIVRASYGNIRLAARFVRIDADDPARAAVIVEAAAHDLQVNNAVIVPVRRNIMTSAKGGRKPRMFGADMVNTTVMAATSIALRNATLAVVPKAIWIEGYQRVIKVLQGDAKTLAERRKAIIEAFGRKGIAPKDLYAAMGVKDEADITIEHMPKLHGMMTALAEGESVASVLGQAAEGEKVEGFQGVADPLSDGGEASRGAGAAQEGDGKGPSQGKGAGTPSPTAASGPAKGKETASPQITGAQYVEASKEWLATGAGSGPEIDKWWKLERVARLSLKLTGEQLDELEQAKETRKEELAQ